MTAVQSIPVIPQMESKGTEVRADVQALRGLAILLVLIYHSNLVERLKAGYLGVDVFFVVSGFLITGIVQRAILLNNFSFAEFYGRRAKRLLPAAYVTFLVVTLASTTFLVQSELADYMWQLLGAVTFTGNIALWMQTGYFEGAADLKPLLHVWSLSIEEQYYLLMPATLVFLPRRFWVPATIFICIGSLLLCLILAPIKPGATFYLLPTRAWELALGSLGVLVLTDSGLGRWMAKLFWPAIIALIGVPLFPTGAPHPGIDALIVCLATLIVILRRHPRVFEIRAMRPLVWFGDISYSLYLVHWPLFAYASNAWVSPIPDGVRLALVVLSCVLAWMLYRWVEQPLRHASIRIDRRFVLMTVAASIGLLAIACALIVSKKHVSDDDLAYKMRANVGLNAACEYSRGFSAEPECQTSATPRMLIWGDSTAMHLVEGIQASTNDGLLQATRSVCGPFLGLSKYDQSGTYNREWAKGCVNFTDDVLAYLATQPSIEIVVLASFYGQYLPPNRVVSRASSGDGEFDGFADSVATEDAAVRALSATIRAVRGMGKRVVLVAPPPSTLDVNYGRCVQLKNSGRAVLGADYPSCEISESRYRAAWAPVRALLDRVASEADVAEFHFDSVLCDGAICTVEMAGVSIYRDGGHLSYAGSRLLGEQLQLANRLRELAR